MAQPVSSILGDVVKSSRSIAHSDDFEGHKLIQTNSRQLILLDLITKSCGDAKLELFPGARPPDTTFTS